MLYLRIQSFVFHKRNGQLKLKCSATAGVNKVVKDYHAGYCAIPYRKRGEKKRFLDKIISNDLKDYTFVQHDPDSNKLYRYNIETTKGKSIVRSKLGQAFRDRTAFLKKDQPSPSSPTTDTSRSDIDDEASRTNHSFSSSLNVSFHETQLEALLVQSPKSVGSGKRKERDYDEVYYDRLSQSGNEDTSNIPDLPPPVTQINDSELNEIILNDTSTTANLSSTSNDEFGCACFDFSFLDSEDCDLTLEALNDDDSIDEADYLDGTQFRNIFDGSK